MKKKILKDNKISKPYGVLDIDLKFKDKILDALGDQLDLVFSGKKDIETALKDAKVNGTKAMKEAKNN